MKLSNKILEAINKGLHFALDDFEDQDELQGQINSKVKYQGGTKEWLDLMNDVVDLGLPSGTLWCKYNLGVDPNQLSKAENWYGNYYACGELEGNKPIYDWNNSKFSQSNSNIKISKYNKNDNLTELLPEDDAAYQFKKCHNYKFHIPTKEQCEELKNYTTNYWVNNYDPNKIIHNSEDDKGIKSLNGRNFEGKNGNQLFIPAAGFCSNGFFDIRCNVVECNLWSSSLNLDRLLNAYHLYFNSEYIGIYNYRRCHGCSIRPVINL